MIFQRSRVLFALGILGWVAAVAAQQSPYLQPAALPQPAVTDSMIQSRSQEQPQPSARQIALPQGNTLEVLHVLGNVYMVASPQANMVVQIGSDGVLLVDTLTEDLSAQAMQAIRVLSAGPVNFVINTAPDKERYGGNQALSRPTPAAVPLSGPTLNTAPAVAGAGPGAGGRGGAGAPGGRGGRGGPGGRGGGVVIIAHENVLARISAPTGKTAVAASELWPTSVFYTPKRTLAFNDDAIEIIHQPNAHTDGDVLVFFRKSDVIAAGTLIDTDGYPKPDLDRGGGIQGIIDGLNKIVDIAIPRFNQQGGTRIVPGRGHILNEQDVSEYRDMMTIIRDRIKLGIGQGKTLDEIKGQRPTLDYDGLYARPEWTGTMLIETIYKDLRDTADKK